MLRRSLAFLGLIALFAPLAQAEEARLKLVAGEKTLAFTAAEFAALPHTEADFTDPHTKAKRHYAGVAVRELLLKLEAPLGPKLRGAALQQAVLVRATDGYAVVFSLADFEENFSARILLLADREDGVALTERYGPLRLVVSDDKLAARWVRNVISIELLTVGAVAPRSASH